MCSTLQETVSEVLKHCRSSCTLTSTWTTLLLAWHIQSSASRELIRTTPSLLSYPGSCGSR